MVPPAEITRGMAVRRQDPCGNAAGSCEYGAGISAWEEWQIEFGTHSERVASINRAPRYRAWKSISNNFVVIGAVIQGRI